MVVGVALRSHRRGMAAEPPVRNLAIFGENVNDLQRVAVASQKPREVVSRSSERGR